ncbi:flagellin [Natronolimnobius sp. AArcel1]|nr:flagellin [Natronolimnobius sp. AArcel1]
MGFSTSAAAAVMLIAFLIAASVIFPTVFATGSDTGDAFAAQADQTRDQANTAINVTSAEQDPYETDSEDDENGDLTVTVTNDGTNSLDVSTTDLLIDGVFIPHEDLETTVIADDGEDERPDSTLWSPGTVLEFDVDGDQIDAAVTDDETDPDDIADVKIVTETAITESAAIEQLESDVEGD